MIEKAYIKMMNKDNRNLFKQIIENNFTNYELDWDNDVGSLMVIDCESFQWQLVKLLSMAFQDFNIEASILIVPFFDSLFIKYLDKINNQVYTAFELFVRNLQDSRIIQDGKHIINQLGQKNVDTLKAFLICNANSCVAANELYIHRNTFNYRMNQLTQFSHIEIRDLNTLMFLKLIIYICA